MSIKKDNKLITVALDQDHKEKLDLLKRCLGVKNNAKAIYFLLDLYSLDGPPYTTKK